MWAWWLIFVLFAGILGYLAMWVIVSSRKYDPRIPRARDKRKVSFFGRPQAETLPAKNQKASLVNSRLEEIENKVNQYSNRQQEVLARLERLQNLSQPLPTVLPSIQEASEWEEMYYEMRDKKEEMEEEVDKLTKLLDEKEYQSKPIITKEETRSKITGAIEDLEKEALLKTVELLEKLDASMEREMELDKQLGNMMQQLEQSRQLSHQNAELLSELDELRQYAEALRKKTGLADLGKSRIAELQFELHLKEDERQGMRLKIEEILTENEKLAEKMKDLQQRLRDEPYAIHLPGSKN